MMDKNQTVLAKWASEREAERAKLEAENNPPQGIDSEGSMIVTEAEIEEARQSLRRKQRRQAYRRKRSREKGGVSGKTRKSPAGPPVYYSLEKAEQVVDNGMPPEITAVLDEEIRQVYSEIADLQRQVEVKQSYVAVLMQGRKRMASKVKPQSSAEQIQAINDEAADEPKPGTWTAQVIELLRRVGRPLYITEIARELGVHSAKKRGSLLGSISPNASKKRFGLIRVGPSVFALAEWGEVRKVE